MTTAKNITNMNQTISFDAALWDLKKVINRYSYLIKQYSLGAMLLLIVLIDSFFILSNDDLFVYINLSISIRFYSINNFL